MEDLTAPFGRLYNGKMYVADGDAILCKMQMVHSNRDAIICTSSWSKCGN